VQLTAKKGSEDTMMHFINRLRFEVRCPEEGEAFRLRQSFAQTLQPEIVEIIDSVCSELTSEGECVRLETLDIDLGRFSQSQLDRDFAVVFRAQFKKELAKQLDAFTPEERHTTNALSRMELFRHFMLHGTLPWWSDESDMDIDALIGQLHQLQPMQLSRFFEEHLESRSLWARVAFQLNDASKGLIISFFSPLRYAESLLLLWIEKNKSESAHFTEPKGFMEAARSALLRHAPELLGSPAIASTSAHILDVLVKETFPGWSEGLLKIPTGIFFDKLSPSLAAGVFAEEPALVFPDASVRGAGPEVRVLHENPNHSSRHTDSERDDGQRYIVRNCGVILLAPFFKKFFTACGLLDGGNWKNKEAQYQAVHLLGYVGSGSTKRAEYSMVLEKLCCGTALEEPIPLEGELEEFQLQEAELLLASVIEHWKVLKNTSINGFRETFLKRDGLLKSKDEEWLLQVERKTLDILLDSVPWGYSTVALPWNNYLIHVEW
jgi:hypothetical protein